MGLTFKEQFLKSLYWKSDYKTHFHYLELYLIMGCKNFHEDSSFNLNLTASKYMSGYETAPLFCVS
jgi:hypothetical protein